MVCSGRAGEGSSGPARTALEIAGVWFPVNPPRTVSVDMTALFGWAARVAGRDGAPLRVRAAGFTYQPHQLGVQRAWTRFSTGIWAAVVDIEVVSANRTHREPLTVWAPATAISVVPADPHTAATAPAGIPGADPADPGDAGTAHR